MKGKEEKEKTRPVGNGPYAEWIKVSRRERE